MRKLLCFLSFFLLLGGQEIDIISSFTIEDLPTDWLKIREKFQINRTCPSEYLTKQADDPNLIKIVVFDPIFGGGSEIIPTLPKEKLILFVWEPGFLPQELYDSYSRVYTWDDSLVDNVKFYRFQYPYLMPYRGCPIPFEAKKLCGMVVGNWTQERLNILKFFEANYPQDLECYGRYPPGLMNRSMHKGHIPGLHSGNEKIATLQNYRFCICFENTIGLKGYITEKIFSCFAAGSIPIYWGSDNIDQYIPTSCYIDYRNFASNAELHRFLSTISRERYEEYIKNIDQYLESEQAQLFSPQHFDRLLQEAIETSY